MASAPAHPNRDFACSVDERAGLIQDEVCRLRFLHGSWRGYRAPPSACRLILQAAACFLLTSVAVLALIYRFPGTEPPLPQPRKTAPAIVELVQPGTPARVWLVERRGETEVYSNGLRIETQFETRTNHRDYSVLAGDGSQVLRSRSDPAGIVFHTLPTQPDGPGLLAWVREKRLFHFVVDRYGRVFRVVAETDVASHAEDSIWESASEFYADLDQSFFGVLLAPQGGQGQTQTVGSAQIFAAQALVAWLRSRYAIPVQNCVTHAQVSVGHPIDCGGSFLIRQSADFSLNRAPEAWLRKKRLQAH